MKDTVLITGASKGIGKATALRLAAEGYGIWLNYRSDHASAEEIKQRIEEQGGECLLLPFDVSDAQACRDVLDPLLEEHTLYGLVNNAGFARDAIMAMMSDREWNDVLAVHLNGFFNVTSRVLPFMLRKRRGRIVNIASVSGLTGVGGQVNYSAAKAGLIGATRSLAVEVAKRHVLVNAIAPGFIESEMLEGLPLDKILPSIPAGRLGKPEDVAGAVTFLLSQDASYMTGQTLSVNGGIHT